MLQGPGLRGGGCHNRRHNILPWLAWALLRSLRCEGVGQGRAGDSVSQHLYDMLDTAAIETSMPPASPARG